MKSDFTSRLKYGVSAFAVAAVLPFGIQASYAADDAAAAEEVTFEEVVVTGSRIIRKDLESVSPLLITSSADIKLSGHTRIEDMMNSLPQIETAQTAFISNGATGAASLDLRGMGSIRTLVLVNGRRLQPGGIAQSAPDINQIPAGLVKQAEVLTGGASATYGADAVAGVVNFVMDKDFEGMEVTAGVSAYQHNNGNDYITPLMDARGFDYPEGNSGFDGAQYNVEMIFGSNFADDKGHATVYASWRKVDELRQGARDYSSCALNNAGTACGGSANAIVPNFYISTVDENGGFDFGNPDWNLFSMNSSGGLDPYDGSNVYNYAPINHFQRPDERWAAGAFIDYEINEHFKPYMEFSFMTDRTKAQIAESGTFFAETYTISCSNPMLTPEFKADACTAFGLGDDDSFATYIGKRNTEGGPRSSLLAHNSFRLVTGMGGDIDDNWSYDVSFLYGQTSSEQVYINDFFAPKIVNALDVILDDDGNMVCRSGGDCIPYNVFTPGGVTPEAANSVQAIGTQTGISKEYVVNAFVTGELPFAIAEDNVAAVFGVEYRKEVYENTSDEVFEQGLLLGQGGPTKSVGGSYDVKEFFAELNVPLVQNVEMAQNISLELAYRYSDYDTSGGNSTYKVGASWQVIDEVKFRGSYNRAVRAPNVVELFNPQSLGLWSGNDPCAGATPTLTAAQCANTGVTAAQYGTINESPASQYNGFFGGNPDLKPEVADTFTVGVQANPIDGLRFSVDFWDIQIEDVISTVPPELAVEQCGLTGAASFCDLVNRAGNGSLWLGQSGYVVATNVNLAGRHWRGIDFTVDYQADNLFGADGVLDVNFVGTRFLKKEYDPTPDIPEAKYDCNGLISNQCFAQPKWRHSMKVAYSSDSFWSVSVKWRHFGGVNNPDVETGLNAKIDAQNYFDLKASFDVTENVGLLVGVNNIFDKEPPMVGGGLSTNANTIAGYYDTLGRYFHASVTTKF